MSSIVSVIAVSVIAVHVHAQVENLSSDYATKLVSDCSQHIEVEQEHREAGHSLEEERREHMLDTENGKDNVDMQQTVDNFHTSPALDFV